MIKRRRTGNKRQKRAVKTTGLAGAVTIRRQRTYNNPAKALSVDIEAELKAGHVVEPAREIQLCAIAAGVTPSSVKRIVDFFNPPIRRSRLRDGSNIPPVDAGLASAIEQPPTAVSIWPWASSSW